MRKFLQELIHGPGRMRRLEDRIEKLEKKVSTLQDQVLYDDGTRFWPYMKAHEITMRDAVKALYSHLGAYATWNKVEERRVTVKKYSTVNIDKEGTP